MRAITPEDIPAIDVDKLGGVFQNRDGFIGRKLLVPAVKTAHVA